MKKNRRTHSVRFFLYISTLYYYMRVTRITYSYHRQPAILDLLHS